MRVEQRETKGEGGKKKGASGARGAIFVCVCVFWKVGCFVVRLCLRYNSGRDVRDSRGLLGGSTRLLCVHLASFFWRPASLERFRLSLCFMQSSGLVKGGGVRLVRPPQTFSEGEDVNVGFV